MKENRKRFVGPDGEFVSTFQLKKGFICIGYLEELCEWLYFHDNLEDAEKFKRIKQMEGIVESILNGSDKEIPIMGIYCNYIPTWSTRLEVEIKTKDMEIHKINRKNREITVLKMKVTDLDERKCSNKFLSNSLDGNSEVYVKCDESGNLEYRGKKLEYRLYPITSEKI